MWDRRRIVALMLSILSICICVNAQSPNQQQPSIISKNSKSAKLFVEGRTTVAEVEFTGLDDRIGNEDVEVEFAFYESDIRQLLRKDLAAIEPGDKLNYRQTEKLIRSLMQACADKGYFNATVVLFGERLQGDRMKLIVSLQKGPVFRVWNIRFRGNQNFSEQELQAAMRNCLHESWGKYDRQYINYCAQKDVRSLMYGRGYFQAKINELTRQFSASGVVITIVVSEGIRYLSGDITITGARAFSTKDILEMLGFGRGDVADGKALQDLLYKKLEKVYKDKGYIEYSAEFKPKFIPPKIAGGDGTVNIALTIDEGRRFTIGKIEFPGVASNEQEGLIKNLSSKVSEPYSQARFEEDIKKLNETKRFWPIDSDRDVDLRIVDESSELYIYIKIKLFQDIDN